MWFLACVFSFAAMLCILLTLHILMRNCGILLEFAIIYSHYVALRPVKKSLLVLYSSEVGRGSFTPDAFAGIGSSWGFGSNDDDADIGPRASWSSQSNPPSTQVGIVLQHSYNSMLESCFI